MSNNDSPHIKRARRAKINTAIEVGPYPQKSHPCPMPLCERSFKRLEHLKRHVRTHTQERPYICNQCNKAFTRPVNLTLHRRTHKRDGTSDNAENYSGSYSEEDLENEEDQLQAIEDVWETSEHSSYMPQYTPLTGMPPSIPQGDGRFDSSPVETPALFDPPFQFDFTPSETAGSHFSIPAIHVTPPSGSLAPKAKAVGAHHAPVREPPAWRLNYKIGTGACGIVFLENVHIPGMQAPELWAVKRIPRALPNFSFKRYQAEVKNLQALARHEWFVKFNSTYEDTHYMYIAMEYIPMGDMSQSFAGGYRWNENDTKVVAKQLLHGLVVMHKEGITHRDLKPENIFLYLPENQAHVLRVKIGDFGTSKRIPRSNASTYLKTTTGTQSYMAPEVHDTSQPKTNMVDIWSLGCILYRMFAGNLLFNDPVQVWKYALTASSSLLALDSIGLSIPCVSFLHDILQPIPEDRPNAEDCLKKAWITSQVPVPEYSIGNDLYTKLSQISHQAPNVHSFPDMVANRAVDSSSVS